jgi:hypothetical protein
MRHIPQAGEFCGKSKGELPLTGKSPLITAA